MEFEGDDGQEQITGASEEVQTEQKIAKKKKGGGGGSGWKLKVTKLIAWGTKQD